MFENGEESEELQVLTDEEKLHRIGNAVDDLNAGEIRTSAFIYLVFRAMGKEWPAISAASPSPSAEAPASSASTPDEQPKAESDPKRD